MSNTEHTAQAWGIRSTLVAVADLDRSVAFYRDLGPFDEIAREDTVSVLGGASPSAVALILRQTQGIHHVRHGQQSLGVRSINFSISTIDELDRIESVLRAHNLFTARRQLAHGASELVSGRDPDNLPLLFVCYKDDTLLGPDYYQMIAKLGYSLDT